MLKHFWPSQRPEPRGQGVHCPFKDQLCKRSNEQTPLRMEPAGECRFKWSYWTPNAEHSRQKPTETCGVLTCVYLWMSSQTEPNCSGDFKQHKHRSGLVCAVGKSSLQQAGGARRSKHGLMVFTLVHSNVHCAPFSQSHDTWSSWLSSTFPNPSSNTGNESCTHVAHNGSLVIPVACPVSHLLF